MAKIPKGKEVAFDTETTGLNPWHGDRPFVFSFCNLEGDTGYIRWEVDPYTRMPKPTSGDLNEIRDFLEDERRTKIAFNSKFDTRMAKFIGIETKGRLEDVFFMAKILRSNEPTHALKPLAKKYVDFSDEDEKELRKAVLAARREARKKGWRVAEENDYSKDPSAADYWLVPDSFLKPYAVGDAERTALLYKVMEPDLDSAPAYRKFYERELALQEETMAIEEYGVRIRPEVVCAEIKKNESIMSEKLALLKGFVGDHFNPNSTVHVADFVYGKLKLPVTNWTPTGKPAVDLEALRHAVKSFTPEDSKRNILLALHEYKASEKAIKSFFQKYLNLAVPDENGYQIIHPNFNQVGPITGRYSCSAPNLQNAANATSVKAVAPIQARTAFCPRVGYEWYCFDYDSQEAWIFGAGANEQRMIKALMSGDLHTETAEFLWGKEAVQKEFEEVGKKKSLKRIKSKMLLYGIIYGMGIETCAELLGTNRREAEETLQRYYTLFPNIKVFMDEMISKARRQGYIATAWGRRIHMDTDWAYRSVNYFVQGTAADMMKDAIISVGRWLRKEKLNAHIIMTVHDELDIEIDKKEVCAEVLIEIKRRVENHYGYLKGIPVVPSGIARVVKSWNLQEKEIPCLLEKSAAVA